MSQERRYPMPCPGCRRMIDARDRLCPYCGIDTDAKLAPLRALAPFVAIGLVVLVGALLGGGRLPYVALGGLAIGAAAILLLSRLKRR